MQNLIVLKDITQCIFDIIINVHQFVLYTLQKFLSISFKLKWKKVSGSNIEYKIFANGECVGTTEKTSFKHSGLTPQTAYTYQIVACTSYYDKDLCVHAIDGSLAKGETVVGITN